MTKPPDRDTGPIRAISMKTPDERPAPVEPNKTPALVRPKLRKLSEVTPIVKPVHQDLGNLAPPYDPNAARMRTMQDYIIWGCVAVILACAITLIIWFVAR